MGVEKQKSEDTQAVKHKSYMYTDTEVLHGVLYLEAHNNRF
jgi:hypothetical protein